MDKVLDFNNFEILRSIFVDQKLRQSIRLLCVFGCGAGEVIYVTNEDKVYCFGRNRFGGLGLGIDEEQIKTPVLNDILSGKQLSNISCGFEHWIALTTSGRCYAWGHNDHGQLGFGTVESTSDPQVIKILDNKKIVDICCGAFHTLALTKDGLVYGWGHNQFGQLGIGSCHSITIPKQTHFDEKISCLSTGIKHSIALTVSGRILVWGLNSYGQLGREIRRPSFLTEPQSIPVLENCLFSKAVCGPNHTLLLTTTGDVFAFGDNKGGQIGNGAMEPQTIPFKVGTGLKFKDIIAHKENDISIGVTTDDKFYIWGLANNRRELTPKEITSGDSVFDIYAKNVKTGVTFKTVIINKELKSWEKINKRLKQLNGSEKVMEQKSSEELPQKSLTEYHKSSVQSLNLIPKETNLTINDFIDINELNYYDLMKISADIINNIRLFFAFQRGNSVIFITKDDRVYGMGFNRNGGLGLGRSSENIHKPELNPVLSGKYLVNIVSGYEHCLGLTVNGELYSWGQNKYGQLGIGSYSIPKIPLKVEEFNDKKIVEICCGAYHSMAVTSDGELFSWGHNTFAQLGDKSYNSRTAPTQVLIKDKVVSISCGTNHSLALTVTGYVYVWGCNESGQLGRPKERDIREHRLKAMCNRPHKIPGFQTPIIKAICGPHHTMLLTTEGFVYTFGENSFGQIGNGSTETQFTVFQCNRSLKIKEIIAHWENDLSIAVSENNKVYVWGLVRAHKVLKPKSLPDSYGKSMFDIHLKLAKHKITYKAINIFEDEIQLNQINNNSIDSIETNESLNQFNNCFDGNSSLNSQQISEDPVDYGIDCGFKEDGEYSEDGTDYSNHSSNSELSSVCKTSDLFGKEFLKHLNKSFNNSNNSDLKLTVGDQVIYCHKSILQIRNQRFWQILSKKVNEENEIQINPKTFQTFYAFIQFIYGIIPDITLEIVDDLRQMAKHFDEQDIEDLCDQYMNEITESIDVSNVCYFYGKSVELNLNYLEDFCLELIRNNWKLVLKSTEFHLMEEFLSQRIFATIFK